MANFLTRMAARALGSEPVAQPVVPALFTPGFGLAMSDAPRGSGTETAAYPRGSETAAYLEAPESVREATLPQEGQALNPTAVLPIPESPSPVTEPATQFASRTTTLNSLPTLPPEEIKAYASDPSAFSSEQKQLSESAHLTTSGPESVQQVTQARRLAEQSFSYGRTIPPNARSISRRDQASGASVEAPVIRVTIGRIDVRAQFPVQASSPAPMRQARTEGLSLDEYLKQRSEGKR
jgi:hypothetical protein